MAEIGVGLLAVGLLVLVLCVVMVCETWEKNNKRNIAEAVKQREKNEMLEYIRIETENAVLQHESYYHVDNIDQNKN